MHKKVITVFGSSRPTPADKDYISAYKLGKGLANAGFDICSGGYFGIMEAVSKGAFTNGGRTIGVTLPVFGSKPNEYLTEEIGCLNLFERVEKLISLAEGYVIYPGGTGTLVELAFVWELLNKGLMNNKPVIVTGGFWDKFVGYMNERMELENNNTDIITICTDENGVLDTLNEFFFPA